MDRAEAFASALHKIIPAFLAIAFSLAVIYAFLVGTVSVEAFLGPAGMAIGYFLRPQPGQTNGAPPKPPG